MRKTIPVILLVVLLVACVPVTVAPMPLPTSLIAWTIRFTQSGGIMGMSRSIEVSSDGKYSATDERAEKTIEGQLSVPEMSRLKSLVSEAAQFPSVKPNNGCADCFIYTIEIFGLGQPVELQATDVSLPDSGLMALVDFLRGVMEEALK